MSAAAGLSAAQVDSFCSEGYVVCKQLLPAELVQSWRSQFWGLLDCSPDEPSRWPEAAGHHETDIYTTEARERLSYPWADVAEGSAGPAVDLFPVRPCLDELPQVRAVVDQLLGAGRWCSGQRPGSEELDTVIFRWPRAPSTPPSALPTTGHVEGGNRANFRREGWLEGELCAGCDRVLEPRRSARGGHGHLAAVSPRCPRVPLRAPGPAGHGERRGGGGDCGGAGDRADDGQRRRLLLASLAGAPAWPGSRAGYQTTRGDLRTLAPRSAAGG